MAGIGGILGAASSLTSAFGGQKSLKSFMSKITSLGLQVKNKYEVNFSGISDVTFFVTSITTPGIKQNIAQIYHDGKMVEVPVNFEYEHDFTMTVLNDASGWIYSTVVNFLMSDTGGLLSDSGYTMTIKAIGDNYHKGSTIKLNGVRFKTVSGLQFGYADNDIQTFEIGCSAIDFNTSSGSVGTISGIVGALNSLGGG